MTLRLADISPTCDDVLTVARSADGPAPPRPTPTPASSSLSIGTRDEEPDTAAGSSPRSPRSGPSRTASDVDLVADDKDEELARLLDLGATKLADVEEFGHAWTVLQDPEGNEFCLAASTWPGERLAHRLTARSRPASVSFTPLVVL